MFPSAIIAGVLLGLSQIPSGTSAPAPLDNDSSFIIKHAASDYFPNAKTNLSRFDVHARFKGYSAAEQSWLTGLNPASGKSDEEKAQMLTAAAFAKPFDEKDPDMAGDANLLLSAVAGNTTALEKRASGSNFKVSLAHAVNWGTCSGVFSCLSGYSCTFDLKIGKAPRSECEKRGGSSCCISWSDYTIRAGFFQTTWTTCNDEVKAQHKTKASCEGYGSSHQGGDVCLSNRADGCT